MKLCALLSSGVLALALAQSMGCVDDDAPLPEPRTRSETYDQRCAVDDDCVIVSHLTCQPCGGCGDLAIALSEVTRFNADSTLSCPAGDPADADVECGACDDLLSPCVDGVCQLLNCSLGECPAP